jgi:hypothetical protein
MNLKQALKRIEELERKVRELEARPPQQVHHHYHQHQPQPLIGQPVPQQPMWTPGWPLNPGPTCVGNVGLGIHSSGHFQ